MNENSDAGSICRDDDCKVVAVHQQGDVGCSATQAEPAPSARLRRRQPQAHHRPARDAIWAQPDPEGLSRAVLRAASKWHPKSFSELMVDVVDDYGTISPNADTAERSLYRHIAKLVERGRLIKIEIGLAFAAYLKPNSKLLKDPANIREHMLGKHELHPTTKKAPVPMIEQPIVARCAANDEQARRPRFEAVQMLGAAE